MGFRRTKRKTIRRRGNFRRRHRRHMKGRANNWKRIMFHPHRNMPLPQSFYTKVHFKQNAVLTPSAAIPAGFNTTGKWTWNSLQLNNLSFPFSNFESGSVINPGGYNWSSSPQCSPIGHTTFCNANMYGRYQVLAAKVKFTAQPTVAGDRVDATIGPIPYNYPGTLPGSYNDAIQYPWFKSTHFCPGEKTRPLSLFIPMAKFMGQSKSTYASDISGLWSAPFTQVPANGPLLCAALQTSDNQAPANNIGITFEIIYYVKYYNVETISII